MLNAKATRTSKMKQKENQNFSVSQFLASFIDHPRAQRNILRIIVSV